MRGKPIQTLAEDFVALGLISEEEALTEQEADPRKQAMMQKKMERERAMMQKKLAKKQAMMQKKMSMSYEDFEDDDFDPIMDTDIDDEGGMDEAAMQKIKKARGVAAIKARKAAKKYYKRFKSKISRVRKKIRHSALGKRIAKWFAKHKARKGYRRAGPPGSSYYEGVDMMDELGNTVDSLRFDHVSDQLAETFYNVARLARATGNNFSVLAEDYISSDMDYDVLSVACESVCLEALEFAEALSEHGDSIATKDQHLLKEHLDRLVDEAATMAEMCDATQGMIDEANGDIDDDDDFDLEEAYAGEGPMGTPSPYDSGYSPQHAPMAPSMGYEEYGEAPYRGPMAVWKNDEVHVIGNTMHPLGWHQPEGTEYMGIKRLSSTDKAVRSRTGGIGYGFHLSGNDTYTMGG